MNKDSVWNIIIYFGKLIFVILIVSVVFGFLMKYCDSQDKRDLTSSHVEEIHIIDSIKVDNSKLVIEVNNLDSIKNVETIEVKSLDNDSTLKLFYKLIGK